MLSSSRIADLLETVRERWRMPALSAFIARGGDPLFSGGVGAGDASTIYPIASVTKTFTARLALDALDRAGLRPDTAIADILPTFRLQHPIGPHLTVRQALNHQGPLPPHLYAWLLHDVDRRTFIRDRLPHLACYADPQPRYRYSNILYAVLGAAAGYLEGESWEQMLKTHILHPLGLKDTRCMEEGWSKQPGLALPHEWSEGRVVQAAWSPAAQGHIIAPASELLSSVTDLDRWLQNSWGHGVWNRMDPEPVGRGNWAMASGWRTRRVQEENVYWHSGQCTGYTAWVFCRPSDDLTGALLCNLDSATSALRSIMESLLAGGEPLSLEDPPRSDERSRSSAGLNETLEIPSEVRSRLPGRWHNPGYGDLEITDSNDGMNLCFQEKLSGSLRWTQEDNLSWVPDSGRSPVSAFFDQDLFMRFEPATEPIRWVRNDH